MQGAARPADVPAITSLVQQMLGDEEAGWNIGTFGALAEFHHVENDPPPVMATTGGGGEVITRRGGIRIAVAAGLRPVAFEGLSHHREAWSQTLAFCLPAAAAAMGARSVLTELGPDQEALREPDQSAALFDMGVGAPHVDFCIRTADPGLIRTLRRTTGLSVWEPGSEAMAAIVVASPHRVCRSRLGRIEVYQPIPPPVAGARSPIGPHTHVFPEVLRRHRTHSANTPIPAGWVSALNLHPASPLFDRLGQLIAFDHSAHAAFQEMLRAYASPDVVAEKDRILRAVLMEQMPETYVPAPTRAGRLAARAALRQMLHTHSTAPGLRDWLAAFDRGEEQERSITGVRG